MNNIFNDVLNDVIDLGDDVFTEAFYPDSVPYLKTVKKRVSLPQGSPVGRGNLCFLYTHNLEESISVINSTVNFLNVNHYKYYYYNLYYQGKIYNKTFRFREIDERENYYKTITDKTRLMTRNRLANTQNDNKNMYYELFRYIEIFTEICKKIQPIKYIELYWNYMKQILTTDIPGYNNRFVVINLAHYNIGKEVKENLENPLFLLYYTMYKKPELLKEVDLDFYFYLGNKVLKINPSACNEKTYIQLRVEMGKIMDGLVSAHVIDSVTSDTTMQKEEIISKATAGISNVISQPENDIITNSKDLVRYSKVSAIENEIENKVKKHADTVEDIAGDEKVDTDEVAKNIESKVRKEIEEDRELMQKLYYQNKNNEPLKSEASTARDKLLREEQKNITVGNMTIEEIEKINAEKINIPVQDVSKSVTTTNENVKRIRFNNLDKEYNEKLMKKDIVNAILALNDKSIPMFIRDIQIKDSSDELNYKDTYTILLEDGNRKRHTIKVDIPKFVDDRFLYIGGNKKVIKHQSFYLPVVKIASDMVQIVTNYSKMTIQRVENKSTSSIERMKKLVAGNNTLAEYFVMGSVFVNNFDHITTIEYDDLSKTYSSFKSGKTYIMFDQNEAKEYMKKNNIPTQDKKIFIGKNQGKDCFIDIDSQVDQDGNSIIDIILNALPTDISSEFGHVKAPKRLMFGKVRIMKQFVSVGMLLGMWEGLTTLMKKLNLEYRLEESVPNDLKSNEEFLKFSDCILVYKQDIPTAIIMNGLRIFDTSKYRLVDFDGKEPYIDYIKKVYGNAIIENALMNFYEFAVDPITLEICKTMNLPTDIVGLYIYACKLLSDSQYILDINQDLHRIRCNEIIPAILYERLSKNYVSYRNFNGRKKYSIPQDCVIKEILALKTVEDYSVLNPTLEMEQIHAVSTKGFRGVNLDEAYTMEKRGYDPSMIGVISPSTSPDGQVGVSRTLTLEPNIINLRGFTENKTKKLEETNDTNLFSPGELTIPLGAAIDDPNRLGHAIKQSKHVIPVKDSSPVLISNGFEEVARFHLTSNFVVNAEEDGEIVDYDEQSKIMIAKYKSGKCRAIDLSPNIVKNGGGGFFLSNILTTELKVGSKFKKDDVLAYHKDFFKNDRFNNCRMTMGTLAKVAIMSTYNTYEDATCITQQLSERCATEMCFCKSAVVGKNSNVFYMVKKGQEISVGEPLISFDTSYEDDTINQLLANLGQEDKDNIMEGARNEIKSKYSGVIEDIKIYPTVDLDEMSPSMRKIVNAYYRDINKKKEFLDQYDPEAKGSIVKCGMLVTDVSHKIQPNRFGVIKGEKVEDSILIEFYIKHSEPLEIGSKIAHFTALKNTIGEIIPKGYEPYSSFRPEEEVSTLIASNSILNRMTPSILLTGLGSKCIIELKRRLKELNYDRPKMEKMIYSFFSAFDKSGSNTKKYKALFQPMSDAQFKKYFTEFFENEYAYLILDIIDYERSIGIKDIEDAAKSINIPLYEYVSLPHLTMDKSKVITTKHPVPVGYYPIKRTQQTVMKKNGISTDIAERSAITNQVTGKDKNGRESDLENTMLTALGMTNTLKELNAPRADDAVMKQQMLRDISLNGFTRLEDMDDEIKNKTTLNTVDCYIRGMTIQSDLVVKGLMLPKTLDDEL